MLTEIRLPDLGLEEEPAPVLSLWLAERGEQVYEGDHLVEILVAGATFDVSSPASGRLTAINSVSGDSLHAGQVLGWIESDSL